MLVFFLLEIGPLHDSVTRYKITRLCWDASCKQRQAKVDCYELLCFGTPTVQLVSWHVCDSCHVTGACKGPIQSVKLSSHTSWKFRPLSFWTGKVCIFVCHYILWRNNIWTSVPTKSIDKEIFRLLLHSYKVFWITLIVAKYNKNRRVSLLINHWFIQYLRTPCVLWGRHYHWRVAYTILPDQDPGKVHVTGPDSSLSVTKCASSVSCKIHTASIFHSWKGTQSANHEMESNKKQH